jgi:hypothetical protein
MHQPNAGGFARTGGPGQTELNLFTGLAGDDAKINIAALLGKRWRMLLITSIEVRELKSPIII